MPYRSELKNLDDNDEPYEFSYFIRFTCNDNIFAAHEEENKLIFGFEDLHRRWPHPRTGAPASVERELRTETFLHDMHLFTGKMAACNGVAAIREHIRKRDEAEELERRRLFQEEVALITSDGLLEAFGLDLDALAAAIAAEIAAAAANAAAQAVIWPTSTWGDGGWGVDGDDGWASGWEGGGWGLDNDGVAIGYVDSGNNWLPIPAPAPAVAQPWVPASTQGRSSEHGAALGKDAFAFEADSLVWLLSPLRPNVTAVVAYIHAEFHPFLSLIRRAKHVISFTSQLRHIHPIYSTLI
ncbi:hypothetical protein C8R43DRAFT_1130301 [Mycena crocata]|nr:hypothetical protein C8R43DRAFT_1130301 [Mycena crocata]